MPASYSHFRTSLFPQHPSFDIHTQTVTCFWHGADFLLSCAGNSLLPVAERSDTHADPSAAFSGNSATFAEPSRHLAEKFAVTSVETWHAASLQAQTRRATSLQSTLEIFKSPIYESGFADAVKSGLNRFDPAKRETELKMENLFINQCKQSS
ncbi:MAG: hypothetical protein LBR08_00315 [Bacteroidales bacterium]|jgi:hypothetical protein|nr:hypothetical protein [Bacteroidales bacterium]